MGKWGKRSVIGLLAVCSACTAARQQVAEPEDGSYIDPWGTPVAWSSIPASSSTGTPTPAASDTEEAKPKAEEEATPVAAEAEPAPSAGDLGGDDDSDD